MVDDRDLFAGVVPFVAVAEELSFRRAAERLGVSAAAVSKAVAKLEGDLGAQLLNRTSRQVALTREGEAFLERSRAAIASLQEARERVSSAQRQPQGELRLSVPLVLGRVLVPAVVALGERYRALRFRVSVTDRFVRLAEDDVDVAVRIGALEDSSLGSRLLAQARWKVVASPGYLARRGTPRTPQDLAAHDCLVFLSPRGTPREWPFRAPRGGPRPPGPKATCLVDNGDAILAAAMAGQGVCQVFDFMARDALRDGRLVEVLADWAPEGPPIHAVWLPGRRQSPKVRACVEALRAAFVALG